MYCASESHLSDSTHHIITHGGEGLILRLPNSVYENGRTSALVKLKVCSFFFFFASPLVIFAFTQQYPI
jgi:ATP-dependent DNA ligase